MIDLSIEKAIIGAFILEPNNCVEAIEVCRAEWFSDHRHQQIFEAIQDIQATDGGAVDLITVVKWCPDIEPYFIAQLTSSVSSSVNVLFHTRLLQQFHALRVFKAECLKQANSENTDPFAAIAQMRTTIESIDLTPGDNTRKLSDIYTEQVEELTRRSKSENKIIGKRSGFPVLDQYIGGLVPGEVVVIAGRPSMGKTAFAVNLMLKHCAQGGNVLMFSIEMPSEQIAHRAIAAATGINGMDIRQANLTDYDLEKISRFPLPDNFHINDNIRIDIDAIAGIIRKHKVKYGTTAVVIDYMQLIRGESKRNREQEIAYISRRCKQIAKEFDVCVLPLAQLNREADKVEPSLSHLRESGAIEQDADTVLFPYRPHKDDPAKPDNEKAFLIIAKCRNGKTGHLEINFHSPTVQYTW